ncbi:MAG: hypothetical protein V1743_04040 [Nanoarchaeota archaeon]
MGLFNLFRKPAIEVVPFAELESFLAAYTARKELDEDYLAFIDFIEEKIEAVQQALQALEEAKLMNEKIPDRVKHILEGNRKIYIQKISVFLGSLEKPGHIADVHRFQNDFSKRLDELSLQTQKNFLIIKEFLEEELSKVVKHIKEIEDRAKKLVALLEKHHFQNTEEIRELIQDYHTNKRTIKVLEQEKQEISAELDELMDKRKKIEKKLKELKEQEKKGFIEELRQKEKEIGTAIKRHSAELNEPFFELEKALRKYKRASLDEKLIDSYLADPHHAVHQDAESKIIEVLEKLDKELGHLGIETKKFSKIRQAIKRITKEFLENKSREISMLQQEKHDIEQRIREDATLLGIMEHEKYLQTLHAYIADKQNLVKELADKIDRLDEKKLFARINELLSPLHAALEEEAEQPPVQTRKKK